MSGVAEAILHAVWMSRGCVGPEVAIVAVTAEGGAD